MNKKLPDFFKLPHTLSGMDAGSPILLGLSGGADSSALLHLLCAYRELTGAPIYAAHVNHGIRTEGYGNEAIRDQEFCRRLCQKLSVELFIKELNVPLLAKSSGNSIETEAREARYAFFTEIMQEKNIKILATAHNADDNLETLIFNLCRGSGVDGMCGIPEIRDFAPIDGIIIRPIISAAKSEILDFCESRGIEFVTDSTNLEDDCTRNRIRHLIIPELRALQSTPEKAGLRLARAAREDCDFIERAAEDYILSHKNGIDTESFNTLSPSVAKRVLKTEFSRLSRASLEQVHLNDIIDFAKKGKNGSISLPGKINATVKQGILYFTSPDSILNPPATYDISLRAGLNLIPGTDLAIFIETKDCNEASEPPKHLHKLTEASLKGIDVSSLTAASRQGGDKIRDGGMGKKIKKLMCDKKVDPALRDLLPIIKSDGEPIYVPFCAVADRARATKNDRECKIALYKA